MVVVGAGRIGTALKLRADAAGASCVLVGRGEQRLLEGPQGEPVILAVRNDDLLEVLSTVPPHRRSDLVFVQNGAIRDFLRENALSTATRCVLYVMVAQRGEIGVAGSTSYLSGPQGGAVARWLWELGLPAEDVDWARFSVYELEKLLWLAIFGPLCQVHGATVGQVAYERADEVRALVEELCPVGRAALGADPDRAWLTERMLAYAKAIPDYTASVKEWPWRNGWLRERAARHDLPTPLHDALLARVGHPADGQTSG